MKPRPEIVIIAAVAQNGVIGKENKLPWHLKADLAYFKKTTSGHPILMGRKTWESLGRPLPGRRNLVISRSASYLAQGAEVFSTPEAAISAVDTSETLFIIGGALLYQHLLPDADRLLITRVQANIDGDAWFPDFLPSNYIETLLDSRPADAENDFTCHFIEYRRKH